MITIAAIMLIIIGLVHSFLGEKYILMRLFKRDNIPHLLGSDSFTKGTLRFCWHIMSVAAFGFAAILFNKQSSDVYTLTVIGSVFVISALLSFFYTKGRHLSWVAFLVISGICFWQAFGA